MSYDGLLILRIRVRRKAGMREVDLPNICAHIEDGGEEELIRAAIEDLADRVLRKEPLLRVGKVHASWDRE